MWGEPATDPARLGEKLEPASYLVGGPPAISAITARGISALAAASGSSISNGNCTSSLNTHLMTTQGTTLPTVATGIGQSGPSRWDTQWAEESPDSIAPSMNPFHPLAMSDPAKATRP